MRLEKQIEDLANEMRAKLDTLLGMMTRAQQEEAERQLKIAPKDD